VILAFWKFICPYFFHVSIVDIGVQGENYWYETGRKGQTEQHKIVH
jgi:hypothetical protein